MKTKYSFLVLIILFLVLSACTLKEPLMDQPAQDGNYHYRNKDLGFNLVLPSEFIYYQTQRKETDDFIDLEFFVPTSDTAYFQEVFGYAKPIVIRIFNKNYWESISNQGGEQIIYQKLGEKKDFVYSIRFWQLPPADWQAKWTEEMKQWLINNFEII